MLSMLSVRDRLPKYMMYGWLSPVLVVSLTLIIDIVLGETDAYNSSLRPCYASFLKRCTSLPNEVVHLHLTPTNETAAACTEERPPRLIQMKSCWIQNGKANLLFFGLPIFLIIIVNGIFFFVTVWNIRKKKRIQKKSDMRRFSKVALPADQDLKLYIQMASIMGFTWISGLVLPIFSPHDVLAQIFTYLFILANGSIGIFIFFAFIFRPEVKFLYRKLFSRLFSAKLSGKSKILKKLQAKHRVSPGRNTDSCTVPSVSISVSDGSTKKLERFVDKKRREIKHDSSSISHASKQANNLERIDNSENDEVFF